MGILRINFRTGSFSYPSPDAFNKAQAIYFINPLILGFSYVVGFF